MRHALATAVRRALQAHADPARAPQMQRYMKSEMPYYGVAAPIQKRLWRELFTAHPLESCDDVQVWPRSTCGEGRGSVRNGTPPSR